MSESSPLRGRDGESALIGRLLSAAARGEGSILVIEGPAGFGKTRLLRSAVERAAAAGIRTGWGGAEDGGQAAALMTLMSALFTGPEPLLDRAKLRELPSAPEQRFWLVQELAELLEAAALASPLLICLDDLQWADPGTLAAVRSLPKQLADLPIVWMVALRPEGAAGHLLAVDDAQRLAGECLEAAQAHGYPLRAWMAQELQALLAAACGDHDAVRELTGQMIRWALPRGIVQARLAAHHASSLAALGRGDFEEAYQEAAAISPPGILASHVPYALRVPMDLVEAAVRTGRHREAIAHVAAMRQADLTRMSPRLAMLTSASAALAASSRGLASPHGPCSATS